MHGENRKLLLILTGLLLYLVIGAEIFKILEEDNIQTVDNKVKDVHRDIITKYNISWDDFEAIADKLKRIYQKNGFAKTEWNFYTSLYFCGSVVTTIGYGNMTPRTNPGRLTVILYAIFGIPLNIWALKSLGDRITAIIAKLIAKVERRLKRKPNNMKIKVVITTAFINIGILLLGGYLYNYSEGWTYLEGVYYCFIVYSTIGFGDLVPDEGHSPGSKEKIAWFFLRAFNLMIGLSLLSSLLSSITQAADEIKVVFPVWRNMRKVHHSPNEVADSETTIQKNDSDRNDQGKTSIRPETIKVEEVLSSENEIVETIIK